MKLLHIVANVKVFTTPDGWTERQRPDIHVHISMCVVHMDLKCKKDSNRRSVSEGGEDTERQTDRQSR